MQFAAPHLGLLSVLPMGVGRVVVELQFTLYDVGCIRKYKGGSICC